MLRGLALLFASHDPGLPVEVAWRGEASCPALGFRAELAEYLAETKEPRPLKVAVEVKERARRWTAALELTTTDGTSRRSLTGSSCAEVSEAAAFVTAVVVDPGVLMRSPGAPAVEEAPVIEAPIVPEPRATEDAPAVPEPPLAPLMTPPPVVAPQTAAPEQRPRARRILGFVRPGGGFEAFGMPGIGPQANLAGGLIGLKWRAEVFAMYRAPSDTYVDSVDPPAGARVRMWAVGARGCGVLRPSVLEVPLCVGIEAGQVIARGLGYGLAQSDRIPWAAALVGPALAWAPRRWFALWLGVDAGIPLVGGSFESDGAGVLFKIIRFSLRAGVGVELRF